MKWWIYVFFFFFKNHLQGHLINLFPVGGSKFQGTLAANYEQDQRWPVLEHEILDDLSCSDCTKGRPLMNHPNVILERKKNWLKNKNKRFKYLQNHKKLVEKQKKKQEKVK